MLDKVLQNSDTILIIAGVAILVILVFCLIARLFRVAIGIAILAVVVPIVFTIFWGDGTKYVSKFASLFNSKYQTQIEEIYQYYKDKDAEDPFIDYDTVTSKVSDSISDVFSKIESEFDKE